MKQSIVFLSIDLLTKIHNYDSFPRVNKKDKFENLIARCSVGIQLVSFHSKSASIINKQ